MHAWLLHRNDASSSMFALVLLFHSSVTAYGRYHEILWLCLQSARPSGGTSLFANCVHWAEKYRADACSSAAIASWGYANLKIDSTLQCCHVLPNIMPTFGLVTKTTISSTMCLKHAVTVNARLSISNTIKGNFISSFQILSARYAGLQLTLTSACLLEKLIVSIDICYFVNWYKLMLFQFIRNWDFCCFCSIGCNAFDKSTS